MSNYERIDLDELENRLREELSIELVHETYSGFEGRTGTMSVCPFCNTKKLFLTAHNTFRCYGKCQRPSIDIFWYYQLKFNVNFYVAKISLARDFGHMRQETAERLLRGKSSSVYIPKEPIVCKKPVKKEPETPKQSPEVISNVYEAMSMISPLRDEQKTYLRNIRRLSEDRIAADYFNLPYVKGDASYKFMDRLLKVLKTRFNYDEKHLIGVPGFYMDDNGRMVFSEKKGRGRGICMKARAADGKINGIQVRNYDYIKDDGDLYINDPSYKYLWVTSRDKKYGIPAGAVVDIRIPKGNLLPTLVITEGKFKSEIISKAFEVPVASIQGVGQWKYGLESEIDYITKNVMNIENIAICFDGDVGTNLDVYRQSKEMASQLLSKYNANIMVGVWDQRFGKGLDDVILSQNEDKVSIIFYADYLNKYEIFLSEIKKRYDINGLNIFYKNSENKVDKNELANLYNACVLKPLGVATVD